MSGVCVRRYVASITHAVRVAPPAGAPSRRLLRPRRAARGGAVAPPRDTMRPPPIRWAPETLSESLPMLRSRGRERVKN